MTQKRWRRHNESKTNIKKNVNLGYTALALSVEQIQGVKSGFGSVTTTHLATVIKEFKEKK